MFYKFRLQLKESYAMPNVLGNHNMPVHTYRWTDVAVCNKIDESLKALKASYESKGFECRIWNCMENKIAG